MKTKRLVLISIHLMLILTLSLVYSSCSNQSSQHSDLTNAVVTHGDPRLCPCCGGYFIDVDTNHYRTYSFPGGQISDADLSHLPLNIAMRYHIPTE